MFGTPTFFDPSTSVLITGIAGFIGFHTARRLKSHGVQVMGIDSFIPYYDPRLKKSRKDLLELEGIEVQHLQVENVESVRSILREKKITHVVHLAAQAGVRHSLVEPWSYLKSNIDGFLSLLEALREHRHIRTVWASSSSVYGLNSKIPFQEDDRTDSPANLYGATKKANEVMAFSYHHLFNLPLIALRFFTVYGPWGRPDMAYYSFAEKIMKNEPIDLYGKEDLRRDFTYIDDIVDGIIAALRSSIPFGTYNLGGAHPESVLELIACLEKSLGQKALIRFKELPKGDIQVTYADIERARQDFGFHPKVSLAEGIENFCCWYKKYMDNQSLNNL